MFYKYLIPEELHCVKGNLFDPPAMRPCYDGYGLQWVSFEIRDNQRGLYRTYQ